MDMEGQDRTDILEEIIKDSNGLISQTRQQYKELKVTKARLENLYKADKISKLEYIIEKQRIVASEEDIDDCLKKLARQKKIAIFELIKLESE